jgi:hypothetical protein
MTEFAGRVTALLLLAVMLSSCGSQRSAMTEELLKAPPETLAARVRLREAGIASLVGKGSVAFESPEMSGSAYFELALKKPDSLLVTFEGPFGINAGFLFLSGQKFVVYNGLENRVITGDPNSHSIRSFIPFDLSLDQIIETFSGGFAIPDSSPARFTSEDGNLLLEYHRGNRTHSYWIDPENTMVVRYLVRGDDDGSLLEATASRMMEQDGLYAPRRITVTFPGEEKRISIYYTSLELNAPNPSFAYAIPQNARTIQR